MGDFGARTDRGAKAPVFRNDTGHAIMWKNVMLLAALAFLLCAMNCDCPGAHNKGRPEGRPLLLSLIHI